ncbi:peptidoglycan bridge formation glycyltransferase FemA/FemB family protein [Candidatus Saccharibacteria bacterium]|nr:peptidoglycan bridge formation glycyltransferase FemA/FemB family protein [Candidatus Saccharibacteria bacterium]
MKKNNVEDMANFLQSEKWAKMNTLVGNKVVEAEIGGTEVYMFVKDAKRGRYLEIPGGPLIDWADKKMISETFEKIRKVAKENECVFVRLRPQLFDTPENREILKAEGCRIAPMHLAAEHTVLIDLEKSEDELLANMRRQTRYEVRRSMKQNIKVTSGNSEALYKEFHQVQAETAARQNFVPPRLEDLLAEREAFGKDATIYVAKTEEGEPIAYGLILKHGVEADYFEAASTELNRRMPGAYALQWQAMRDLKKEGYKRYNLWGIAPPNQPHHRYAGVTTFKTGFGGESVAFVPAQDIVINRAKYLIDLAVETARKKKRHL